MDGLDKIMKETSIMKYAAGLQTVKGVPKSSLAIAMENESLSKVQKELQTIKSIAMEKNAGYYAMAQGLASVLENYHQLSEVTCVAKQLAERLQPLSAIRTPLEGVSAIANAISPFSELSSMVIKNPSLLTCLHSALESQIDTSLWDYWDSTEELSDDDIDEAMSEELVAIVGDENKANLIKQFITRYGEKGKDILIRVWKWLVLAILGGLVAYCSEPIYRVISTTILRQEQSMHSSQNEEIPPNTEIHIWGDVTNNFVEISYSIDDVHYQGYISREEFEKNTQKISNEIELEHICFINDIVEVLSECWNVDNETVYSFMKKDTTLLNDYVLEHYDLLKHMENEELVSVLEAYCEEHGIVIPKVPTE